MGTLVHNIVRGLVKDVLLNPDSHEWTLQGLGMLRTYFGPELRLHVWDDRFAWCHTSRLHTHPWDFESLVVAGRVHQYRFEESHDLRQIHLSGNAKPYIRQVVQCGPDGGFRDPALVHLVRGPQETYEAGQVYRQHAEEIHDSVPENGTVTIIQRRFYEDTEHAKVYRLQGSEHENAGARRAEMGEVYDIVGYALKRWFAP